MIVAVSSPMSHWLAPYGAKPYRVTGDSRSSMILEAFDTLQVAFSCQTCRFVMNLLPDEQARFALRLLCNTACSVVETEAADGRCCNLRLRMPIAARFPGSFNRLSQETLMPFPCFSLFPASTASTHDTAC